MGVQFFGGKFYKCIDEFGELLPIDVRKFPLLYCLFVERGFLFQRVDNKWDCLDQNYTWINSKISFDHVGIAYLALFQVVCYIYIFM